MFLQRYNLERISQKFKRNSEETVDQIYDEMLRKFWESSEEFVDKDFKKLSQK